jgi:hypothetical protein
LKPYFLAGISSVSQFIRFAGLYGFIPNCVFTDLVNLEYLKVHFSEDLTGCLQLLTSSGSLPQDLASNLPLLNKLVIVLPSVASILPKLESSFNLEELDLDIIDYPSSTFGVFPDISKMPNFKKCYIIPYSFCRYAHVPVDLYPVFCDAAVLSVCTEEYLEFIEAARAIGPSVYAFQSVFAAAKAELYYINLETLGIDGARADVNNHYRQEAKEIRIAIEQAEEARVAGLTDEERAAEIAAEELRLANRSDAQRAAEEKAVKRNLENAPSPSAAIRSFGLPGLLKAFLLVIAALL